MCLVVLDFTVNKRILSAVHSGLANSDEFSARRYVNGFPLPPQEQFMWESPYNLEGKIVVSVANEVGDGATSRVYVGTMNT